MSVWTGIAYAWVSVALAALVTVLGRHACAQRWGDYRGHLLYFLFFFLLIGVGPAAIVGFGGDGIATVGLGLGRFGRGLITTAAALPLAVMVAAWSSLHRELRKHYPLSRTVIKMEHGFWVYESVYVVCYYTAWEFAFRGLLFLPLVGVIGLIPALAIQTTLTTLLHIGSPEPEVWGAVIGGAGFGLLACFTGSVLYSFILHATLGVVHDVLQRRRLRAAP